MNSQKLLPWLLAAGLTTALPSQAETYYEMSGKVTADLRYFTQDGQFANQDYDTNLSFTVEPEFYWEWNDGADTLTFTPFLRVDENDNERTHADIRELSWVHIGDDWELRTGLRKVFWGVTEFQHLADVINQTDGVEDFDGEDKLGQQMINLSLVKDWGIVDLFLLPGFRERTFAGEDGRLRAGLVVDTDQAEYESGAGENHLDTAIRWSHTIGDFDLGAYWFHGTNRDPKLVARNINGKTVLVPYYEQMDQIGFDAQATIDSWLWKLETIHRDTSSENYWAAQAGFEYTFYGIQDSAADLGVLLEYGWDERGEEADAAVQNDLFMGARITLNDAESTEILGGISHDLDYDSQSLIVEASRRIGDSWKVSVDGRFFSADDQADLSYNFRQDDHLQFTVERYF
ncbi:hypothetical protein [Neptuniibacter caesariensis]|uniref:Uncharacterized protein n=1 Tax=Neptuniibacter caesariensis TaxID=207954 RepID=A0A7U8C5A7_NEPCE|nr:hypothetical protein [Neptuniibacter caesariensis]EAR61848.1 hypothetical protein MED92_02833 [Oceanospirillum sp. MED92] [Neptuniibacter caesariensis]